MLNFPLEAMNVDGHFILSPTKHSLRKIDTESALANDYKKAIIVASMADLIMKKFEDDIPMTIVGVPGLGNELAVSVASYLSANGAQADSIESAPSGERGMELIGGLAKDQQSGLLVLDDVISTGEPAMRVVQEIKNLTGQGPSGIVAAWNSGVLRLFQGIELSTIVTDHIDTFSPERCPHCKIEREKELAA